MKGYRIQTEDEEVIKLLDSLGRKRSEVLTSLLKNMLEKYDGYLPPYVMAETGCMYTPDSFTPTKKSTKNSNNLLKKSPKTNKTSIDTSDEDVEVVIEKPVNTEIVENPTVKETVEETNVTTEIDVVTDDGTPNITNPDLIFAGLSAFGI